uniref:Uncharacterized protein n=1 Tax=Sphaerodactylus townsendi TaxID=933632 RepID=A0ACB8G5J3_9SAUR
MPSDGTGLCQSYSLTLQRKSPDGGFVSQDTLSLRREPDPDRGPRKGVKEDCNGDPNEIVFFLIQVGLYMEVHGNGFQSDHERVRTQLHGEVRTQLHGEAANWLVGLVEEDAPEIHNLEWFLLALWLANHLQGWPEMVLVQLFKDALDPKVLQWGLIHGDPKTLVEWIRRSGDAKLRIRQLEQSEQH